MYKYIIVPKEISITEISSKKTCLAPSKYHNFHLNKRTKFKSLSDLISVNVSRQKLIRSEVYDYVEIGDIDVNTGHVESNTFWGYNSPSENPIKIELDDILISTVRTYRKGIGMITSITSNILISSPAIFVIRKVSRDITKEYLLAILRSDFFIEQMLSLQNRGMYPRLDMHSASNVQIPIPNDKNIINYISMLSRSLLNKYQIIEEKNNEILNIVRNEIVNNQNNKKFLYSFPNQSEFESEGRIDAGYFSEGYKRLIFETQNYSNGYFTLDKAGLTLIPGPSLELKLLGTRIDSKKYEKGFYRLITPKQFSNYGTISYYEYIGTPKIINPIQYGDILFGESGTGRSIVYLEKNTNTINNAHAHILRPIKGVCTLEKAITIRSIISYYKKIGIIDHLTVGGSGGHLSPSYFNRVFIPDFKKEKQTEIANLYYNPTITYEHQLNLNNFLENDVIFNKNAGIIEIDDSAKKITTHLEYLIDRIVQGKSIEINFNFLSAD